jgi:hypothetical protein
MQERYVSLDPSNAETENTRMRREIFQQRLFESEGGHTQRFLSTQFAMTGSLCTYVYLRKGGFRVLPLQTVKTPKYLAIYFGAFAGAFFAKSLAIATVGDSKQQKYLLGNRAAVLSGAMPIDERI